MSVSESKNARSDPFHRVSKQQILADLALSREQIKNGEVVDFDQGMEEIEASLFCNEEALDS